MGLRLIQRNAVETHRMEALRALQIAFGWGRAGRKRMWEKEKGKRILLFSSCINCVCSAKGHSFYFLINFSDGEWYMKNDLKNENCQE